MTQISIVIKDKTMTGTEVSKQNLTTKVEMKNTSEEVDQAIVEESLNHGRGPMQNRNTKMKLKP